MIVPSDWASLQRMATLGCLATVVGCASQFSRDYDEMKAAERSGDKPRIAKAVLALARGGASKAKASSPELRSGLAKESEHNYWVAANRFATADLPSDAEATLRECAESLSELGLGADCDRRLIERRRIAGTSNSAYASSDPELARRRAIREAAAPQLAMDNAARDAYHQRLSASIAAGPSSAPSPPNTASRTAGSTGISSIPARTMPSPNASGIKQVPECLDARTVPGEDFQGKYAYLIVKNSCSFPITVLGCVSVPQMRWEKFSCATDVDPSLGVKNRDQKGVAYFAGTVMDPHNAHIQINRTIGGAFIDPRALVTDFAVVACPYKVDGRFVTIGKAKFVGGAYVGECMYHDEWQKRYVSPDGTIRN